MNKQGGWTRWKSVQERALTWQDIWSMEGHRIKFLLCSVYDVLPTSSNLHTWGLAESPSCMRCGSQANLEHVLYLASVKSADGKFRWQHDQILTQLAAGVEQARKKPKQLSKGPRFIHFLRVRVQLQRLGAKGSWPQQVTGRCRRTLGSCSNSQRR
ncbi:hypothetical protein N1851_024121 [Merluccius polli]|uniref:Uncharacterized protein n=1 Tax=Merluccius polli TaxID=89951 RepID=A0AA47MF79_MERPO|nr:hypothetical protein N1851_024121 [Merluccius polli]